MTTTWWTFGSTKRGDIEAMAFLVMMEAAKGAREDLKAIMAQVKATQAKSKMRHVLEQVQKAMAVQGMTACTASPKPSPKVTGKTPWLQVELVAAPPLPDIGDPQGMTKAQLSHACGVLTAALDVTRALGEQQQLKLQIYMDRVSKAETATSTLAKKVSEVPRRSSGT